MVVLVGTEFGCRVITDAGEGATELAGRCVSAVAREPGGACLAVLDNHEIWRRRAGGEWSQLAITSIALQSLTSVGGNIFAGSMADDAVMLRVSPGGDEERLTGFDNCPGRSEWMGYGPPLGVRAVTATADGAAIVAAVHVGGMPRSVDAGETWVPTVPVNFDVHEVCAHPSMPEIVAAAASVGLCMSNNGGETWKVLAEGLGATYSLGVAVLDDEVLFSTQAHHFAERSQVWRCRIADEHMEPVRDGLPEWLEGKVDTAHIAAGRGHAAIADAGGNLWLSREGSRGWERIATGLPYVFGVLIP